MGRIRKKLINTSEQYHMIIHILLGIISGLIFANINNIQPLTLISIGIIGNILPDIDHLLYIFIYGRNSEYAQFIKDFLGQKQYKNIVNFCKNNHKFNTGLYSHNILTTILVILITYKTFNFNNYLTATFFFSWSLHYLYDIVEDLLFFGKLNKNWFLKFDKKISKQQITRI